MNKPSRESYFTFWCSDHRPHIQAATFRDAYYYAQDLSDPRAIPEDDSKPDDSGTGGEVLIRLRWVGSR